MDKQTFYRNLILSYLLEGTAGQLTQIAADPMAQAALLELQELLAWQDDVTWLEELAGWSEGLPTPTVANLMANAEVIRQRLPALITHLEAMQALATPPELDLLPVFPTFAAQFQPQREEKRRGFLVWGSWGRVVMGMAALGLLLLCLTCSPATAWLIWPRHHETPIAALNSPTPLATLTPTMPATAANLPQPVIVITPSPTPQPTMTPQSTVTPNPTASATAAPLPTITPPLATATMEIVIPTATQLLALVPTPTVTTLPSPTNMPTATLIPPIPTPTKISTTATSQPIATPTFEATPTIESTPTINTTPTVQATSTVFATPTTQATPTIFATPTVQATPTSQTTPTVFATPTVQATPTMVNLTTTPTAQTTATQPPPTIEATPTIFATPTFQATPTIFATPTFQATPTPFATASPPPVTATPTPGNVAILTSAAQGTIQELPLVPTRQILTNTVRVSYQSDGLGTCQLERGIIEFNIPAQANPITSATLILTEITHQPMTQTVGLTLNSYQADLAVDVADFDRPAALVALWGSPPTPPLDVTPLFANPAAQQLGFRLQLESEPPCNIVDQFEVTFEAQLILLGP